MILAANVSIVNVALGVLFVSLSALILIIAYRQLLKYMGKGTPPKEDYCVLHPLEEQPASGEVTFYFTSESKKEFTLQLLNMNNEPVAEVATGICKVGGNILRFDTSNISNGEYYYQLKTDNQKTAKKMALKNS